MLSFPRPSALNQRRDKKKDQATAKKEEEEQEQQQQQQQHNHHFHHGHHHHQPEQQQQQQHGNDEMPPPPSRQSNRSKRNSGMFDVGHTQPHVKSTEQASERGVQRRTSKRASSQDRHGQVYGDEVQVFRSRPQTPEVLIDSATTKTSPTHDRVTGASPRRNDVTRYELPPGTQVTDHSGKMGVRDNVSRPRTRTLEERIRSRSPQTSAKSEASRKRIGSLQSVSHLPVQEDTVAGPSIGYPSVLASGQNSASTSRQRLIHTPPRPLSPAQPQAVVSAVPSQFSTGTTSPISDAERIMRLMRSTGGRMHGILYFRLSKSSPVWQSGYCAINVGTGGLIYQTKGELAQTKTLIPDLRGCKVRTQFDPESQTNFLEMSTRASGLGIHLRPLVPETFDSWLAALLCWQPLKPAGAQLSMNAQRHRLRSLGVGLGIGPSPRSGASTPISGSIERAPSQATARSNLPGEDLTAMRAAPIVKSTKVLWWDLSAPQSVPFSPPRRISTYKQMRMSAGTPWRKASLSLYDNGLIDVSLESVRDKDGIERAGALAAAVDVNKLTRFAVQRLHPNVLDDEFSLALFTQCRSSYAESNAEDDGDEDEEEIGWPVFLSFETRVLFEMWYAMLRAFTVPELYGPGVEELNLKPGERQEQTVPSDIFRVKRSLKLRITEAQLHAPKASGQGNETLRTAAADEWVVGDYHAEVQIDGEVRGRTTLQTDTSNPFWREDYEFSDLPPLVTQASILLKSRQVGQRDWTLISDERYTPEDFRDADHLDMVEDIHISPLDSVYGSVELDLSSVERGRDIEQWWTIRDERDEAVGRMFLKIRLDETVVLLSSEYEELSGMLHTFSNGLATEVLDKCNNTTSNLSETLLNIFQVSGTACRWIMTMVEDEVDSLHRDVSASRYRFSRRIASNDSYDSGVERELVLRDMGKSANQEANLLFRGNTILTKALELHMRRLGKEYLEEVLGECLRDIDESEPECEVDPNRVRNQEALGRNWRNLMALTESIWRSINQSANRCPAEIRQILRHIRSCTEDRYGAFLRTVAYSSVSAFLFLRLLVPAILNPSLFGLLKEIPRPKSRRTLTMIAKSLQTLANMSTFGHKEPWMEPMNGFLNAHRQSFKDFIDEICSISQDRPNAPTPPPKEYNSAIRTINALPSYAREGSPSLPYLIDQPREIANLVNCWVTSRQQTGRVPIVTEDLARFDVVCTRVHQRTREILTKVAEATSGGSRDVSGNDWEKLIVQLDAMTSKPGPISLSSGSSPVIPSAATAGAQPARSPAISPATERNLPASLGPLRPQPVRTSTAPVRGVSTPEELAEGQQPPGSGKSLHGFNNAAAAAGGMPLISPSTSSGFNEGPLGHDEIEEASSYADEDEDEDDDALEATPPGSSSGAWDERHEGGRARGDGRGGSRAGYGSERLASIVGSVSSAGGSGPGYVHPMSWGEAGSAGSVRSKASSLGSLDVDAANGSVLGPDGSSHSSSALPWSGAGGVGSGSVMSAGSSTVLGSTHMNSAANLTVVDSDPSPLTSPKDLSSRRLVDVLTFRRRNNNSERGDRGEGGIGGSGKDRDKDRDKEKEKEEERRRKEAKREAKREKREKRERKDRPRDKDKDKGKETTGPELSSGFGPLP